MPHVSSFSGAKIKPGLSRSSLVVVTALVLLACASRVYAAPNFVVIMTDDLDERSLHAMIDAGLMPKLKRHVIDRGMTFTNSYVTTAWCCPSRATFLTGQYSHNHNVLTNARPLGGVFRFDDSSTLATWLQAAGYRTGLSGKYLNGHGRDVDRRTVVDDPSYVPPGWDDWQGLVDGIVDGRRVFQMYNYTINDNGRLVGYGSKASDYQTDVIARRAIQFLNESDQLDDSQPFFLFVGTVAPHLERPTPVLEGCTDPKWSGTIRPAPRHAGSLPPALGLPRPPNFNEAGMADKPVWMRNLPRLDGEDIACVERQYQDQLKSLRAVDDLVGRIAGKLWNLNEMRDTVLIFTSDNGFFRGEHRLADKVLGYEEAIRVPLYMRAPGYPGRRSTAAFVLNNDLAPTIAAMAGVVPGVNVDGRSLVPLLQNPALTDWRSRFLVEYRGQFSESPKVGPREPFIAVRTTTQSRRLPDRFYVEWMDSQNSRELYNLNVDPYQRNSKHNQPGSAQARQRLAGWLAPLRDCAGAGCRAAEGP